MRSWRIFIDWRLKDLNAATDGQLESTAKICERLALIFGIAVISGLIIEVIEALWKLDKAYPFFDRWGGVLADVPVAIGVFGEIYFGKKGSSRQSELQRRSNNKLADAIDKATKLEAQLVPRSLTQEQFEVFQMLKGQLSVVGITCTNNIEADSYATQIAQALTKADIQVRVYPHRIGNSWTDIYIVIPQPVPDLRAVPLYQAFCKAGISAGCGDRTQHQMYEFPPDLPVIMVGEKRGLKYPQTPYAFRFGRENVEKVAAADSEQKVDL